MLRLEVGKFQVGLGVFSQDIDNISNDGFIFTQILLKITKIPNLLSFFETILPFCLYFP